MKGLVALPFAGKMLAGMDWAAMTPAEANAAGLGGYSCVVPSGTILPFAGEEAPAGFVLCDGRSLPVAAFQRLHSAIGDAFGTQPRRRFRFRRFHVPDLRASARPAAAVARDESMAAAGMASAYLGWRYVIRT